MRKADTILFFLLFLSGLAFSQGEEQFLPTDLKQLTVITEPATLHKGFFRAGINYHYGSVKKIFNSDRVKEVIPGAAVNRTSSVGLWAYFGITDRLEASLNIPYLMNQTHDILIVDDQVSSQTILPGEIKGFGFGDIALGFRMQVLREKERQPSLTLGSYLDLPTGRKNPSHINGINDYHEATGSGELSLDINVQVRKIIYPYSFVLYSGIDYKFGGEKIHFPGEEELPFKSGNHYYTIAGINFHLNDWICLTNDFRFSYTAEYSKNNSPFGENGWDLSWTPNIHFQVKKLRIAQAINFPIYGRNTSADTRFFLFLQYIF